MSNDDRYFFSFLSLNERFQMEGIDGVENLTGDETTQDVETPERESSQAEYDRKQSELQAERDVHNERTAGRGDGASE